MNMHATCLRRAALTCAALLFTTAALAQDEERSDRWIVDLGTGIQATPKYPGASDVSLLPIPLLNVYREGDPMPVEAPDEGWGIGFLGRSSSFVIGPSMRFQGKRREEDVGAAVGDVGLTVELGGFAQLYAARNFRLRVEGRKGLGGHEGWIGDVSADYVLTNGEDYVFTIGPRLRIADGNFHDAYFGVTPAVATATGLPAFDPGGGIWAVGASAGLTYRLSDHWGVYGFAGYNRLVGDAADSPIVRDFGSRDQFSGGIGFFYTFGLTL